MILPSHFKFKEVVITSVDAAIASRANSYARQTTKLGKFKHYFELDLKLVNSTYAERSALYAFLVSQNGLHGVFSISNPIKPVGKAQYGNVSATESQSSTLISVNNLTPNMPNHIRAGDYVQFGNHKKVYMITSDSNTNAYGSALFTIYPGLFKPMNVGTQAFFGKAVAFQVSLTSNENDISHSILSREWGDMSITMRERG